MHGNISDSKEISSLLRKKQFVRSSGVDDRLEDFTEDHEFDLRLV